MGVLLLQLYWLLGSVLPEKSLSSLSAGPLATLCAEAGPEARRAAIWPQLFRRSKAGPAVRLQLR